MHRLLLAASLSLSLPLALAQGGDWPQFRGPTAQGHADDAKPPTEWSTTHNVAWRTEIPGLGWSSPVVAGGKVYLTTATPGTVSRPVAQSLRALCLDAASGSIVWNVEVFPQDTSAPNIQAKNSHASPTAFVEGDRVYVHFGHMGTACLNTKDGSKVWANRELRYNPVHGNGGSPLVVGDRLIFSIDGTDRQAVVGLDKATGKVAWQTPRNLRPAKAFSFSTPLLIRVDGREQVVSAGSDVVMALDPKSGKELWRVRYPGGYSVVPRPVFADGLVILSTGYDNPALYAIRPTGTGDVTTTHVAWTLKKASVPRNSSPVVVGGALYMVSDRGVLTGVDVKTGAERWSENLSRPFSASLVYAGGHIYGLAEDGTGVVFRPGAGYDPVAANKLGEKALASYAVDGDALFVRTEKALYRIEKK
jgi:outer membrane protein assembly factor BamB